jgi:putative transcriptional regulator
MAEIKISNNIRRLRFDHDEMTQQELAKKTGVSRQTIVSIENEKYSPSLELAFLIAHVFDARLEEVFSYEVIEGKKKGRAKR